MAKIINFMSILFFFLLGCDCSIQEKKFQKYVDYSGMMLTDLSTVFIPDSQVILNLGALCYDPQTGRRYQKYGELNSNSKNRYLQAPEYRNYLNSVPLKIKDIWVDSLLLNTNEISDVPNWLLRKKMMYLDLSSNKIQNLSIPKNCYIESIDLRKNMLAEIPDGFFECEQLKTIYLDKSLKKHLVKSDTIIIHGKKLVFGEGLGEEDNLIQLLKNIEQNRYPRAIHLEKW